MHVLTLVVCLRAFTLSSTVFMTEQATISCHVILPSSVCDFPPVAHHGFSQKKLKAKVVMDDLLIVFHILGDFIFKDSYFPLTVHTQNVLQQ